MPRSWPQPLRQEQLSATWGFTCACQRCTQPWDDCIVLRCRSATCQGGGGSSHGRVFFGKWRCEECGAEALGMPQDPAAREFNLEADLAANCHPDGRALWSPPLPAHALAERLLQHPLLATEDWRVFQALNKLAAAMADSNTGDEELATRVATAIALAALRAAFTSPEVSVCVCVKEVRARRGAVECRGGKIGPTRQFCTLHSALAAHNHPAPYHHAFSRRTSALRFRTLKQRKKEDELKTRRPCLQGPHEGRVAHTMYFMLFEQAHTRNTHTTLRKQLHALVTDVIT